MMKILVIGLVYNLFLQSCAVGEPLVKVQMCSDVFESAVSESLSQIKQSQLNDHFGNLYARGKGKKQPKDLPITKVKLEVLPGIQISNKSLETTFSISIEYGDKKFQKKGRKLQQNSFLFLDMDIVASLQFNVNRDKVVYSLQKCDVYVRSRETNQNMNTNLEPTKKKVCGIVRRIIAIMNENWKDYLSIDPSGNAKLLLKSIDVNSVNCMELNMNLAIGGSEVSSEQRHEMLPGSGISLLADYINTLLLAGNYLMELNKKLEKKNPQLSPEELQKILYDVHETDQTSLIITIKQTPQLKITGENQVVTVIKANLQGYASKSDKSVFEVKFETNVNSKVEIKDNKLKLQFLSCGDPDITDWSTSIGHSEDLDLNNLQLLIKKLNSETLLGALTDLNLSFRIPFWNPASMLDVLLETVKIFEKES